jgi:hypothetical protein
MEKASIIKAALKMRGSGNIKANVRFFTKDALIEGYIYGHLGIRDFFKILLHDTLSLTITVKNIKLDNLKSNLASAHFDYIWILKNEQKLMGTATEIYHFNLKNKITSISASCNFANLSEIG